MRIGILTYFGAHNYGAFLQAYALREVIKNNTDADVELIKYRTVKEVNAYSVGKAPSIISRHFRKKLREYNYRRLQFDTFENSISKYQKLSCEELISDSIETFSNFVADRYDLIIAGSDEIWKVDGFRSFPTAYWLPGVRCRKMAYAVSSRNLACELSDNQKFLIKKYLEDFDYIGARDYATLNMTAELSKYKNRCYLNCDPTFLYDFNINKINGQRILKDKFKIKSDKKVIGLAVSDFQYGKIIAEAFNYEYEVVSLSSYIDGVKNYAGLSPFEWIDAVAACDMLITSRFHGAVFAIKTGRPFIAIEMDGYSKETSKLFDLLHRNDLTRFYIKDEENISKVLTQYIPEFLEFSENSDFNVNYQNLIDNEKQLAEPFINKLHEFEI